MPTALLLHAHPDDEVFANFGWAADLSSRGYDVVGAIATGGEASELHEVDSLEDARARRIAKYEAVLELLGGRSWSWLDESAGLVDAPSGPTVSGAAPQHLRAAVENLIAKTQPDIVLTVGSDGLTGHPDHIVVGTAVAAARNAVKVPEGVWGGSASSGRCPRSNSTCRFAHARWEGRLRESCRDQRATAHPRCSIISESEEKGARFVPRRARDRQP